MYLVINEWYFPGGLGGQLRTLMPPQGWGLGAVGVVGAIKIVEGSIEDKSQETKIHEHSFLFGDLSESIEPSWTSNGYLFLAPIAWAWAWIKCPFYMPTQSPTFFNIICSTKGNLSLFCFIYVMLFSAKPACFEMHFCTSNWISSLTKPQWPYSHKHGIHAIFYPTLIILDNWWQFYEYHTEAKLHRAPSGNIWHFNEEWQFPIAAFQIPWF